MNIRNNEFRDIASPTLDPEFLERTDAKERLFESIATEPTMARNRHYSQMRSSHVVSLLERLNKTTKTFGVEPRYPFFDRRLMEFCLGTPADQILYEGWMRYVLRNAMDGVLPHEVQWRTVKGNLAPSFWRALRENTADDIAEVLFADDLRITEYIDLERARSGYREFADGGRPGLDTVWFPVVLESWLRSDAIINNY